MWLAPPTLDGTGGRVAEINLDPAMVAGSEDPLVPYPLMLLLSLI
jgi:hypothetical protein